MQFDRKITTWSFVTKNSSEQRSINFSEETMTAKPYEAICQIFLKVVTKKAIQRLHVNDQQEVKS